jgi:hypothetical protein
MSTRAEYMRQYQESHREEIRAYQRERNAQRKAEGKGRQTAARPFAGVDGEGSGDPHAYYLLRMGDRELYTGARLTTEECLGFIADAPLRYQYVSFAFDYDVTMILKDLRPERLTRLMDRDVRTRKNYVHPIEVGDYEIDYLPRKEFKVRRKGGQWVRIDDTFGIFASSFVVALTRWQIGSDAERENIAKHKAARSTHKVNMSVRKYCAKECEFLAELMTRVRAACVVAECVPRRWQGAGMLAERMLSNHHVNDYQALPPHHILERSCHAFFGGRFETTVQGLIDSPTGYDINSAYPFALTLLPCLKHATWTSKKSEWGLHKVEWSYTGAERNTRLGLGMLGPFPYRRKDGSIYYPAAGSGWYWSPEVQTAQRGKSRFKIHVKESYYLHTDCDCVPFAWVPDLYEQRKQLGKSDAGYILKLALNSLYGKTAQTIGKPRFGSPVWAGMITSITRAMLYGVCRKAWRQNVSVYMLATDGIVVSRPIEGLSVGGGLGEWERTDYPSLCIVLPGLYFVPGQYDVVKTRGYPLRIFTECRQQIMDALGSHHRALQPGGPDEPDPVGISVSLFHGIKSVVHRGNWHSLGTWEETERKLHPGSWAKKRDYNYGLLRQGYCLSDMYYEAPGVISPLYPPMARMYLRSNIEGPVFEDDMMVPDELLLNDTLPIGRG